ncbi:MAG: 50S ribosomal protein L25 [Dehalococcoidia bacterium]|nr:50S ribosomal protein L25 [Dehalococcoidia bacterium]
MERIEVSASPRKILGKKVRFLRRQGITPATVYGHGIDSTPVEIPTGVLKRLLARAGMTNLINLMIDGEAPRMVVVRAVQKDPLTGEPLHADFYQVRMEEKLRLSVPVTLSGQAPAVKELGGILYQSVDSLEVECLPGNMPHSIEVDVSGLTEIDQAIHVRDLRPGQGIVIVDSPDQMIVQIGRGAEEEPVAPPPEVKLEEPRVKPGEAPVKPPEA